MSLRKQVMLQQTMIASEIINRRKICELCNLIAYHIKKNDVRPDASIRILTALFCDTIDKKHKVRETVRLQIHEMKETVDTIIGPLQAYQMAANEGNEIRCILELQECSDPVPTTSDEIPQTQEHPSRNVDTRFSGRLISPKANLELFSKWIKLCHKIHGERCEQPIFPVKVTSELKSLLVIDVERMCIVDAPAQCRYVALSYCWGTALMLRHMLKNSAALRKDGALSDSKAPATISDAIELVKGVGEKYLWVDALCIVQDDLALKNAQLAQMGLIYSLAAFTIVAASGSDANAGLPGVRADTRDIKQNVVRVGEKILLEVVDGYGYYGGLKKSSWSTRAWTMQEKILSKKLLIFTDQQVYWSCWNAVWLEEVVLEDVFNITFLHDPVKTGPADVGFSMVVEPRNIYQLYELLVNAYQARQLTFKSDILNAFSGLCQAMAMIGNESFHWGLPVSQFDKYLCWRLRGGGTQNHAFSSPDKDGSADFPVRFPSWSWAAWHGTSGRSWISWQDNTDQDATRSEINFFSYDSTGRLKQINQSLSAPTEPATRLPEDSQPEETVHLPSQWKNEPHIIQEASCKVPVNTGRLHFWTSTATLAVRHKPNLSEAQYSIVAFHDSYHTVWLDTSAHLQFKDVEVTFELPEGGTQEPTKVAKRHRILEMDFVVVSSNNSNGRLYALVVERKDGVAYRIGIAYFQRSAWASLPNKVWKRVVLG